MAKTPGKLSKEHLSERQRTQINTILLAMAEDDQLKVPVSEVLKTVKNRTGIIVSDQKIREMMKLLDLLPKRVSKENGTLGTRLKDIEGRLKALEQKESGSTGPVVTLAEFNKFKASIEAVLEKRAAQIATPEETCLEYMVEVDDNGPDEN